MAASTDGAAPFDVTKAESRDPSLRAEPTAGRARAWTDLEERLPLCAGYHGHAGVIFVLRVGPSWMQPLVDPGPL